MEIETDHSLQYRANYMNFITDMQAKFLIKFLVVEFYIYF